jgi:hypothetical protein
MGAWEMGHTNEISQSRAAADIVARQHVKTVRGMTAQEKLRKRDDECLDAINKRQLSRRANKEVSIGEYETGHGDDTIHTTSLVSLPEPSSVV